MSLAALHWVEGLKPSAPLLQVAASAGITACPVCFSLQVLKNLRLSFCFYCLVSFVLLNKTRSIAGPGAKVKKTNKGFRWRAFMTRLVFRANSEPNQLGKPDSCACWISGINNAIRPLLSGCSACSSYYLTSRNILEAMSYGSATAAVLQPHFKTFSVASFWHSMFVHIK